ncbi:MAG: hypothetical protein H7Y07_17745 [Pyrinomonadaceae bacterium]|nr:hypothetical protein [Sphingobacteriaceae bacterium]
MKIAFYYTLILILSVTYSFAQQKNKTDSSRIFVETTRARNIFIELGGPGLIYSANFDTRFSKKRNGLGGRIGAGFINADSESIFTLPVGLNYLLGKSKHLFEIGLGATYVSFNTGRPNRNSYTDPYGNTTYYGESTDFNGITDNGALGTMTFGYRLQPLSSGFSFRGQFNTLFGYGSFIPYGGLSLGYTF